MAKMTIYLPDAIKKKARKMAKADGKSVSRWIACQIAHDLDGAWPQGVLDAAGADPDFPTAEELARVTDLMLHGCRSIDSVGYQRTRVLYAGTGVRGAALSSDVASRTPNSEPGRVRTGIWILKYWFHQAS